MEIRQLTVTDYKALYQLWTNTDGMGLRNLDDSKEGIAKFLKRNPTTNFVVVEEGILCGAILGGHDGRRGYIYHALIKEGYRNRGYGQQLVASCINAFQKEGILKVALVVYKTNAIGNQFWEKLGFTTREDLCYRNLSLTTENI